MFFLFSCEPRMDVDSWVFLFFNFFLARDLILEWDILVADAHDPDHGSTSESSQVSLHCVCCCAILCSPSGHKKACLLSARPRLLSSLKELQSLSQAPSDISKDIGLEILLWDEKTKWLEIVSKIEILLTKITREVQMTETSCSAESHMARNTRLCARSLP